MWHVTSSQELSSALPVIDQDLDGRLMQRHQAGFAELGGSYRQDTFIKINVIRGEAERFANAEARHTEQAEKTMQGVILKRLFRGPR
jgi:hypothetical protein